MYEKGKDLFLEKGVILKTQGRNRPEQGVDDDLLRRVYGSRDFREGVDAFLAKRPPRWTGE